MRTPEPGINPPRQAVPCPDSDADKPALGATVDLPSSITFSPPYIFVVVRAHDIVGRLPIAAKIDHELALMCSPRVVALT